MIKTHGYTKCIERRNKCTGGSLYFRAFNRLIFPFSLSHHIGKSPFSISTYMEEVLQQIFSLSIWKGRCDVSPFYWGLERNYWGSRKNKREREMKKIPYIEKKWKGERGRSICWSCSYLQLLCYS